MKNIINGSFRFLLLSVLSVSLFGLTSCNDDKKEGPGNPDQGVVFELTRVETIKLFDGEFEVDDIKYIKVWVTNSQDTKFELPTLAMSGDSESSSSAVGYQTVDGTPLTAGQYNIHEMWLYGNVANNPILKMQPTKGNAFEIVAGQITYTNVPLEFVVIIDDNPIINVLSAICKEVIGDDESLWPWDFSDGIETYQDLYGWPYIELDIASGIVYGIVGFCFEGDTENGGGPWDKMESLPRALTYLPESYFLTVRNLPNFKRLGDYMDEMYLMMGLHIENTGFEGFPDYFFDIYGFKTTMDQLMVKDCPNFKDIPAGVGNFTNLKSLWMTGNGIESVDLDLSRIKELDLVNLSNNKITSISDRTFGANNMAAGVYLDNNPLNEVPSGLAQMPNLRTLDLRGINLNSIPAAVKNPSLEMLNLADNNISTIGAGDLAGMEKLMDLMLDNNPLTSIDIVNDAVKWISLTKCGLTAVPDLSGVPNLLSLILDNNSIGSVSIDLEATGYDKLRYLSLNGNSSLSSLSFSQSVAGSFPARLRYLMVNGCPNLTYSVPAGWNGVDYGVNGIEELIVPDPELPIIESETSVWVDRRNSPGVTL